MNEARRPFPPLVDFHDADWSLSDPEVIETIASRNNELIEQEATRRLEIEDNIYDFVIWLNQGGT